MAQDNRSCSGRGYTSSAPWTRFWSVENFGYVPVHRIVKPKLYPYHSLVHQADVVQGSMRELTMLTRDDIMIPGWEFVRGVRLLVTGSKLCSSIVGIVESVGPRK